MSVHVAPRSVTETKCFSPIFNAEIDQLSHHIFLFIAWNICIEGGKVICCYRECFIFTAKFFCCSNNRLAAL